MATKRKKPTSRQLANPGERSKIATALLPAKYQAARRVARRQRAEDANPLYDPSAILSGHRLASAARDIVDAQIKPQVAAVDRSIADTQRQGGALATRAADYYKDLAASEQGGVDVQRAIAARLNDTLTGIDSGAKQAITDASTREQAHITADDRGQGLEGGARERLAAEMAAQSAQAATVGGAFRAAGAQQGAGGETLANQLRSAGILKGGETQTQLANRTLGQVNELTGKRTDLEAGRGDLEAKTLQDLRQGQYENLVTARGLGIKQEQIRADVSKAKAEQSLAGKRLTETHRSNVAGETIASQRAGETARHNTVSESQGAQRIDISRARVDVARRRLEHDLRTGPKEPAAARAIKRQIGNALSSYQRYLSPTARTSKGKAYTLDQIDRKARDAGVPEDVIAAARDIAQFGYLTPESEQRLKVAGVRVPSGWHKSGGQSYAGPH